MVNPSSHVIGFCLWFHASGKAEAFFLFIWLAEALAIIWVIAPEQRAMTKIFQK